MINPNEAFEDLLYHEYLTDPDSVSIEWQEYFKQKKPKTEMLETKPVIQSATTIDGAETELKPRKGENLELLNPLASKISINMEESLGVPTATSFRTIPVKVLDENRRIINKYLEKLKRPKVSFTHILAWAIVKALVKFPNMNDSFEKAGGKAFRIKKSSVNFGLAVDIVRKDGTRMLLVPNIKDAENIEFKEFVAAYDSLIYKTRNNKLNPDDLAGTTCTLTNPGMIGTSFSMPRLMKGQGLILAVGSIDYPVEFQAMRPELLTSFAVSKVVTISSTYDHRIIQGAESAEFLNFINKLLVGKERFYDQIFYSLKIPFEPVKWESDESGKRAGNTDIEDRIEKGAHVMLMINAYRVRGHLLASVNPLGFESYYYQELDPAYYGLTIWDLDRLYHVDDSWEKNNMPLRDTIELLRETYCGTIGYEFMHIQYSDKKEWVKNYLESSRGNIYLSPDDKVGMFRKLLEAEIFENFLHTKFVGHKRFSLEGGESVIMMLDKIFEKAADSHSDSIVLGMSHRGRLNVLVNNIGKDVAKVFKEFDGIVDPESYHGSGDVKYHLGDKGVYTSALGNYLKVILSPNPSHLELVDPVIVGMARAIANEIDDNTYTKILPIIIHGDAAFAGQGIVAETLNLSQLEGYKTGGTIHIIINNQIGFTTTSDAARSTVYATDIAKMIQPPILHVNGNDPEAVVNAALFAMEYRNAFHSDVIIDMFCYRKYGHNESDEPSYTQPLLYKKIKLMPQVSKIYEAVLINSNLLTEETAKALRKEIVDNLNERFNSRKNISPPQENKYLPETKKDSALQPHYTSISEDNLNLITNAITHTPEGFHIHPKLASLLNKRAEMVETDAPSIDWSMAEALALGAILLEGRDIRFSGQDSQRGTFSQRHAVLTDIETEDEYVPLNHIKSGQGQLRIWDSPLSEMAVLGFEYGYSVIASNSLTVWEAQFGDFANNCITIVDQFLACAESKWGQTSNLVMLLPHSYDGQGSEHSSARLERYLQLCADENMIVGNFTTPAQYFHALRRQMFMTYKIPLILMTPKAMLRHPLAVSGRYDITKGEFLHIIDDDTVDHSAVRKVILCSGKIFYELLAERNNRGIKDIAIVRIEQIYPLHKSLLTEVLATYNNAAENVWVQEEPENMGAWRFIFAEVNDLMSNNLELKYVGRKASASTATGNYKIHLKEQAEIIDKALS